MAKTQKTRSAAPKGKDSKNGSPLQKSFKKGSRPADAAQQVTRAQNSTFLSYIRSALKSHNDETKSEAEMVHAHYLTLTADQKRGVIAAFLKLVARSLASLQSMSKHLQSRISSKMALGQDIAQQICYSPFMGFWDISQQPQDQPSKNTHQQT